MADGDALAQSLTQGAGWQTPVFSELIVGNPPAGSGLDISADNVPADLLAYISAMGSLNDVAILEYPGDGSYYWEIAGFDPTTNYTFWNFGLRRRDAVLQQFITAAHFYGDNHDQITFFDTLDVDARAIFHTTFSFFNGFLEVTNFQVDVHAFFENDVRIQNAAFFILESTTAFHALSGSTLEMFSGSLTTFDAGSTLTIAGTAANGSAIPLLFGQRGLATVNFTAVQTDSSVVVNFAPAFPASPSAIVATVVSGAGLTNGSTLRINNVSANSFTILEHLLAAPGGAGTSVNIYWVAIQ